MKELFKKKIEFIKSHPRVDIGFVLVGLGIFTSLTLFNATRASVWFDEAFSGYIAQFNFAEIAQFTAGDVHPPLYYWILKLWEMLFGTSDLALRSLSVLFGAAVIVVAYLLARRLFGRLAAGVSLAFLVVSPMLVRYSDEGRMYTMAALIVLGATYLLVKATESNRRRTWVFYGILVGLGMWTHYFTALIWIAHWVWRAIVIRQGTTKWKTFWPKFFSKNWIIAHVVAVGSFIPWLPFMVLQLGGIQGNGFWIGPVGADSFTNYFTNIFYYLEHGQVQGWLAGIMILVLAGLVVLATRVYKSLSRQDKQRYLLITVLAFVPVILLFIVSLPPIRPSFVERYLLPAIIGFAIFAAVTLVIGSRKWRPAFRIAPIVVIVGMMIYGVTNVYYYGNYNKNSSTHTLTHELVEAVVAKSQPGEPIIANSPWIFYEAVFYSTTEHPVYFIDAQTDYIFGSLDMLKDRDLHKIKDLNAFSKEHAKVWYIGITSQALESPNANWKSLSNVTVQSPIDNTANYKAVEFTTH